MRLAVLQHRKLGMNMLRIHEVKRSVEESIDVIPIEIIKKLGIKGLEIKKYQLIKESIDARNKSEIKYVYSVDFQPILENMAEPDAEAFLLSRCTKVKLEQTPDTRYEAPAKGSKQLKHPPVIVGFGPCGMFAGLLLAELGYEPIILERGKQLEKRIHDVENFWQNGVLNESSNVQFGEGGAGLFSDGKLTTQIKNIRVRKVLGEFVKSGGPKELLYKQKPHIGTDVLRKVVISIRKRILENGGQILFEEKLNGLDVEQTAVGLKLKGISLESGKYIETEQLILAIGHSARDTFRQLHKDGVVMSQKPFSIGVRVEHPQSMINTSQYGVKWEEYHLGAADYKLSHHCNNGRGVYTFCMCPGGYIIGASSQENCVVTNGMSYHNRDADYANSALLVDVNPGDFESDHPLSGLDFQEKYEKLAFAAGGSDYSAPAQKIQDFMKKNDGTNFPTCESSPEKMNEESSPSYRPGFRWADLTQCLPAFAVEAMKEAFPVLGRKLKGFDGEQGVMVGVETRSSSPVRILRDEGLMGNVEGIYPAGEGAGYAGGIMSAAVDGIKAAEEIVKGFCSLR